VSTIARLTLAQYDRMIERGVFEHEEHRRLEFIRGEIREMNPIGPLHEDVVNLPDRSVEVRRDPHAGRYRSLQTFTGEDEVHPLAVPEVVLRAATLFSS